MEETNNGTTVQSAEEDRLSMLTDDILLSILGRVDISTAVRTSLLSARWSNVPWLLPELNVDVKDFLPVPNPNTIEVSHMDDATASLTKVARSFLSKPRSESTVTRMHLTIYLINNFSGDVGPLLIDAIDSGRLKDLDLIIMDEKDPPDCSDEEMLQKAQDVNGFFNACPSVLVCLTKLSLYNVCFGQLDIHHVLFDFCKQLKHIALFHCDAGRRSIWKIDAPHSELWCFRALYVLQCCIEKLEVVCLPKLEKLHCDSHVRTAMLSAHLGVLNGARLPKE